MPKSILSDTDVLIDYLRAREDAVTFLESQSCPMLISSITVAELYAGVREGKERLIPHSGFNSPTFYVEKIDKDVLDTPMLCVGEYVIFLMILFKHLKSFP